MKQEKKYFMAGTDEEVMLGDVVETELVKDFKDGRKLTRVVEFKLTEDTLPIALEMGIIEEGCDEEEEGKNDLIDFDDDEDFDLLQEALDDLIEDHVNLEKRVESLEKQVKALSEAKTKNASAKKK